MEIILIGGAVVLAAIVLIALVVFIKARYQMAKPDEALVITGRNKGKAPVANPEEAGKQSDALAGQKVIIGSGTFIKPFFEDVHKISLSSRKILLEVESVVSKNNVPLVLKGVAIVKVGGTERDVRAAAQRFLGQQDQIEDFSQNVLNGSLRAIIGEMTVEEVLYNRENLAARVQEVVKSDLSNQGLVIDTLQINEVDDRTDYIANLSRPEAARVKKEADIAEAENKRETAERTAEADSKTADAEKKLALHKANIKAETEEAEAKANAAGEVARANEQQRVLHSQEEVAVRNAALKERELDTTVRKPADAERYRREQEAQAEQYAAVAAAKGEADAARARADADRDGRLAAAEATKIEGESVAAATLAQGEAEAKSLREKAEAYKHYNQAAVIEMALKTMPEVAAKIAEPLASVKDFTIISKDGASKLTDIVTDTMGESSKLLKQFTGLDLGAVLADLAKDNGHTESSEDKKNELVPLSDPDDLFVDEDNSEAVS